MRRGMVFKLGATYVGTVVGAGFASGQEHLHFFGPFSPGGGQGVLLAGALFIAFGVVLGDLVSRRKTSSPEELFQYMFGPALSRILDVLLIAFTFCSLSIMLAGTGALVNEHMSLPRNVGIAATGLVTMVATASGVDGLLSVNALMSPVLVIMPLLIVAMSLAGRARGLLPPPRSPSPDILLQSARLPAWPLAGVLYVSYNLLLVVGVFGSMGNEMQDAATARRGGLLGGATLAVFLVALHVTLMLHGEEMWRADVPMLVAAAHYGPLTQAAYSFSLWSAMVTTAVAGAFSLSRRLARAMRLSQPAAGVAFVFAASLLAQHGFVALVGTIYPLFGYLGLPLLLCASMAYLKASIHVLR